MSTTLDDKIAFLEKASSGTQFTVGQGDAEYEFALEAYQRYWIGRMPDSAPYYNGSIAYIAVFELTSDGYAALEALRKEREDARVTEKVKRAGTFIASRLWELLLASIGSGVIGGIFGYILRGLLEK